MLLQAPLNPPDPGSLPQISRHGPGALGQVQRHSDGQQHGQMHPQESRNPTPQLRSQLERPLPFRNQVPQQVLPQTASFASARHHAQNLRLEQELRQGIRPGPRGLFHVFQHNGTRQPSLPNPQNPPARFRPHIPLEPTVRRPVTKDKWWSISRHNWLWLLQTKASMAETWTHVGRIMEGAGEQVRPCDGCKVRGVECYMYGAKFASFYGTVCARCRMNAEFCSHVVSDRRQIWRPDRPDAYVLVVREELDMMSWDRDNAQEIDLGAEDEAGR
ncbi:hypothetical protein BKA81DRAFT_229418 [Phyllosticta paracitricarpa]|uniref:Uncharacterized protein n=1 Tax=Phyllosticta paracitricarpa TaxID=2016321 RepID=A0ABR1NGK1_9PEZI